MTATVISVANQKGGVAKSTSAQYLAVNTAMRGKKTAVIDNDEQGSLTYFFGYKFSDVIDRSLYDVYDAEQKYTLKEVTYPTSTPNLDLIPAILDLSKLQISLYARISRETILKRAIDEIKDDYDFIFIDCPPSAGIYTLNALTASDYVIIPIKTDRATVYTLNQIFDTIDEVKAATNADLKILGGIATLHNARLNEDKEALEDIKEYLENENTPLLGITPDRTAVKEGVTIGKSLAETNPSHEDAVAYSLITDKIIKGVKGNA